LIRNIVGQVKSTIDLRDIMDTKKILLLNLSKGRMGEDNSALLGAMMITKIQLAAMSRVEIEEEKRVDFYLYVDEFQNFATESFANILSEARKYRLDLIIAHQYIEQLSDEVRAAVFGNVGTIISFRVGAEDAEFLAKEYAPRFDETDLVNLSKYEFYLKLMIDGVASEPFSAVGLPPFTGYEQSNNLDKVIKVSREKYTKPRQLVEEKITRWSTNREKESAEEHKRVSQQGQERPGLKEGGRGGSRFSDFNKPYQPRDRFKRDNQRSYKSTRASISERPARPTQLSKSTAEVIEKEIPNSITLMDALKKAPTSFKNKKTTTKVRFDRNQDKDDSAADSEDQQNKLKPGQVVKF